ncbi:carboxylesterase/lipase family protein [Amycolatopsis sp. NPDC059090]|uniref:carboxylesterase/lipase family protein n=1 Tax=unclassified Amycolatopsis TaxID=2618356 RepID=UPI0036726894
MIVKTTSGNVRGTVSGGIAEFKGIPYAAPLDGGRRFAPPEPAEPWDGVRDATEFSAAPPQAPPVGPMPAVWSAGDSTECLSVNVWTPEPLSGGPPVFVWVHGGAFLGGVSSEPSCDGARFAAGGAVVVTMNYRVGFEGFGWLPDAPSNRGILDQIAALRWVQDNVAGFGGDPSNVTIAGESAGGASVAVLLASPLARGLFRRAIVQSSSSRFVGEGEARRVTEIIAAELGVAASARGFAEVASERVHRVQNSPVEVMAKDRSAWTTAEAITPFYPIVDGVVLEQAPWQALRAGASRDIDLIAGFTRDEFAAFAEIQNLLDADPRRIARDVRLPESAVDEYRAGNPGITDGELVVRMMSDSLFRMSSLWCAEAHAEAGGRTFLYEVTWDDTPFGACHAIDIPLVFGNLDQRTTSFLFGGHPVDADGFLRLSEEVRKSWTAFAGTGDPGWPRYELDSRLTRLLGSTVKTVADPEEVSRRIWHARYSG